jgi:hypothetical protein
VEQLRKSSRSSKIIRCGITASPLLGYKIQNIPVIWPPLGGIEKYAASAALIFIAVAGLLPSIVTKRITAKICMCGSIVVCLAALTVYACLISKYVVSVETPNNGTQYRTIGSQRTAEAIRMFPGESDQRILQIAGLNDGDIEKMWTPSSVRTARVELFLAYVLTLCALNFAVGLLPRLSTGVS